MPFHYKAFAIIMLVTWMSFLVARPVFLSFMSASDFTRRRNVWFALTAVAFLMPNFWLVVIVSVPLLTYATVKDSNPPALYLILLLALPPLTRTLSIPGVINEILGIDHLRLLALIVLAPEAIRLFNTRRPIPEAGLAVGTRTNWTIPDALLLSYVTLQCILTFPFQSITASLRLTFELAAFSVMPYFVLSRFLNTRDRIVEAMAAFALGIAVLVPLGIVEFLSGAVLYQGLEGRWGETHIIGYLMRGEFLRAQVGAGHSLVFGFALAVALGIWMYLQNRIETRVWRWLGIVIFVIGLAVSLARGAWLGAAMTVITFSLVGPGAVRRFGTMVAIVGVICGAVALSPYGEKIVAFLPFFGAIGDGTVVYRQDLAGISWKIIKLNPLFGSFDYLQYMESLRQGEGIIDLVNSYAAIALSYGLVGAGLYVGFYLMIGWGCYNALRRVAGVDADLSLMGASLLACLAGTLLMIGTVSQYLSVPAVQLTVASLASAYAAIVQRYCDSTLSESDDNFEAHQLARFRPFRSF